MIHNKIRVGTLIIILFSFVFLPDTQATAYGEEKQITVVFRYDDYSGSSSTDIEVKLIDAFLKRGIPCVFGVIPFQCVGDVHDPGQQDVERLTPVKVDILKSAIKAGFLEIALHGYSHQTMREKRYTEFEGLDYNSQVEKIEKGKKYLEETLQIKVDTFIPPWNSYDLNTIMVLPSSIRKCNA